MAKKTKPVAPAAVASQNEGGFDIFNFLLRSGAIIAVIALVFFVFDKMNEKQGRLQDLYNEFSQLQQTRSNPERIRQVYDEIIEIQSDTSFLKKITRGYHWAIHDLALKNMESIEGARQQLHAMGADSTEKALLEAKLSMRVSLYPFLDYIRKSTPENAVILLPEGDAAISNNSKWNFIYDPEWVEYFIYPRLCLSIGREEEFPELAKRITHVLIVEGKGYDKLRYNVPENQRPREAVFPIDNPPAGLQTK